MTDQLKLTGLLAEGYFRYIKDGEVLISDMAKFLVKNGVTVQLCRAGEPVYFIFFDDEREIWDYCESEIKDVCNRGIFTSPFTDERENNPESWQLTMFGDEMTFFTKEEAEKALAERNGKNG